MPIKIQQFLGIRPVLDIRLLGLNDAQAAENVVLDSGTVRALRQPSVVASVPSGTRSVHQWNNRFLAWPDDVDAVDTYLANDRFNRCFTTGEAYPKVYGIVAGSEVSYRLGVPRPSAKPTITVGPKTERTYVREWHYHYEEPDGTRKDEGTLTVGDTLIETVFDKNYEIATASIPAKVTATSEAKFVIWFEARRISNGSILGRVYSSASLAEGNSDFFADGAKVTMIQTSVTGKITLECRFNTADSERYVLDRSYVYTYVNIFGEEGPPCDASAVVSVEPSETATITNIVLDTVTPYAPIEKIRLYRTATNASDTEYQFVTEWDVNTAMIGQVQSYRDLVDQVDLAETLPSSKWLAPPEGLRGLTHVAGGFMAGFVGNAVYFSDPGYAHAWPEDYETTIQGNIVGIKSIGDTVFVITDREPFLITVPDPVSVNVTKVGSSQPCLSKRGIIIHRGSVYYPSGDGFVMVSGLATVITTKGHYTKDQWAALDPASMMACSYDDRINVFSDAANLIIEYGLEDMRIVTHTQPAEAIFVSNPDDALYLVSGTSLLKWEGSENLMTCRWRSREYSLPRPTDFKVARVLSDTYPVNLTIIPANAEHIITLIINSDTARRIPVMRPEKFWSFEVSGTGPIRELLISHSMGDL